MTPDEKERMIHIRINNELHKELRKAAAEYDLTMQDIVSEAVEKRIQALEEVEAGVELEMDRLEKHAHELEIRIAERLESLGVETELEAVAEVLDDDGHTSFQDPVEKRLEAIEEKLDVLLNKMSSIQHRFNESD